MRGIILFIHISLFFLCGCSSGTPENPEGKYGSEVNIQKVVPIRTVLADKGLYLNHEIIVKGTISTINEQLGITTFEINDNGVIKCTTEKFKLPKSLEGKVVYVQGMLKEIQVAGKKGRDIGGEYTFAADPLGSSHQEELRLEVTGLQVADITQK